MATKTLFPHIHKTVRALFQDKSTGPSASLFLSWDRIVGNEVSNCMRPVKMVHVGRKQYHLSVAVVSKDLLAYRMKETDFITKINSFLGYPAIIKISFQPDPTLKRSSSENMTHLEQAPLSADILSELKNIECLKTQDKLRSLAQSMANKIAASSKE